MSNPSPPKEQLSAYQRWEMTSFGDERASVVAARKPVVNAPVPPTSEEIARIREDARQEGYASGQETGYADGMAEGLNQGLNEGRSIAAREIAHLKQVADTFGDAVGRADELIAQDLLDLALSLAKAMLKTALPVHPELILPIIQEAIQSLPTLQHPALLHINPDDALLVKAELGEELNQGGWRLVEDAHIARGGCLIETASNQVDATLETRWQHLLASLGKDLDWLAK